MYSLFSDLEKMFYTPNYILFRCLIDGKEYFGRPKDIHLGDISNQKFRYCSFQYWESIEQYLSGKSPQIFIDITSDRVVGLEAIDSMSKKEPSTLSEILSILNDISLIEDNSDVGLMKRNIPALLHRLHEAVQQYGIEHPKAYTENPLYHFNECLVEFENIGIPSTNPIIF